MRVGNRPQGQQPFERPSGLRRSTRDDLDRGEIVERATEPRPITGAVEQPRSLSGQPSGGHNIALSCLGKGYSGQRYSGTALVRNRESEVGRSPEATDGRGALAEYAIQMSTLGEREGLARRVVERPKDAH